MEEVKRSARKAHPGAQNTGEYFDGQGLRLASALSPVDGWYSRRYDTPFSKAYICIFKKVNIPSIYVQLDIYMYSSPRRPLRSMAATLLTAGLPRYARQQSPLTAGLPHYARHLRVRALVATLF